MWTIEKNETTKQWEVLHDGQLVGDPKPAYYLAASALGDQLRTDDGLKALVAAATEEAHVTITVGDDPGLAAGDGTDSGGGMTMPDEASLLPDLLACGPDGIVQAGPTGDGRDFTGCVFSWRDLPLPLMGTLSNGGHYAAALIGFLDSATLRADGGVDATGRMFNMDCCADIHTAMLGMGKMGCSVDPSGEVEYSFNCTEWDEDGFWCMDGVYLFTAYKIAGLTLLPFQAFADCYMTISGSMAASATLSAETLAAPPRDWFFEPEPAADDPRMVLQPDGQYGVPLTITDDGRVYAHAALWSTCHVGFANRCVTPPASATEYAYFHVAAREVDSGELVPCGTLVVGTDHAAAAMLAPEAADHYAHTGLAWANVRAVNGEHGIWICGALKDGVTPEQVAVLRSTCLSGDWRDRGARLELIAALAVSVPGFPITREAVTASAMDPAEGHLAFHERDGRLTALAAAGIVRRTSARVRTGDPLEPVAPVTAAPCADCAGGPSHVHASRPAATREPMTVMVRFPAESQAQLDRIDRLLGALDLRTRHLGRAEKDELLTRLSNDG